ncbi:MAG: S41 family peptidase, partial [Planctomycetota bacterium]
MSRRNFSLLLATVFVSLVCWGRKPDNPHARFVAECFDKIDEHAYDRPADQELVDGAMRGMVEVLRRRGDNNTQYFRPEAADVLRESMSGKGFGGVGIRLRVTGDPPLPTVVGPPAPGTPAYAGGVRDGDRIVAIDGERLTGLTPEDIRLVTDQIRGEPGEPVELTVSRPAGGGAAGSDPAADTGGAGAGAEPVELRLTLTRAIVVTPTLVGDRPYADGTWRHMLAQDPRIALVRVLQFGDQTFDDFRRLLPRLEDAGMRALVIDLRGNPGGSLDEVIEMCDLLLPAGAEIVETRDRRQRVLERRRATGRYGSYTGVPIAVLIDGGSASASEILAACLQDNDRAVVIGSRSFGKGTVQQVFDMQAGASLLKLTSSTYWRPSGENIHRLPGTPEDKPWGVKPTPGFETPLPEADRRALAEARSLRDVTPIDRLA